MLRREGSTPSADTIYPISSTGEYLFYTQKVEGAAPSSGTKYGDWDCMEWSSALQAENQVDSISTISSRSILQPPRGDRRVTPIVENNAGKVGS